MRALVALVVAATLGLASPAAAQASGVRVSVTTWFGHTSAWGAPHGARPGHAAHGWRHDQARRVLVVPTPVYVVPTRCWAPGYWSHSWVPQVASQYIWVPAGWSTDGLWIEGHYETRALNGGSWQPYWVEGRWGAC
jgi:hypothetical protein